MFENPEGPTKSENIDKVVYIIYADATTLRMALETGEIDVVHNVLNRADVRDLEDNPDVVLDITEGVGYTRHMAINVRPEFAPLDDVRVRQAMAFAIFPEEIVDKVLFGTGSVADSPVHPWMVYYTDPFNQLYRKYTREERISKAKELLAEAGVPDGFKTDFWFSGGAREVEYRDMATIIQSQLKEIGIELELKMTESGVFRDLQLEGKISMAFSGWCPDYADPDTDLFYCLHPKSKYLPMRYGFQNERAGELIDLGKEMFDPMGDPPERKDVYEEIQYICGENVPGVWLYHENIWNAYRTYVKDFKFYPFTYMCPAWDARKEIPADWETTEPPH
jgi:peptide/nickel transport system substrate-binding protein